MDTNATGNRQGVETTDPVQYAANIATFNVARNSWQAHWYIPGFAPTVDGTYNIFLEAYSSGFVTHGPTLLARTEIQIIVGQGGTDVPESGATLGMLGAAVLIRRRLR